MQRGKYSSPYLEVLRANEPPEVVWSGVSGQISKLDTAVCQRDKKMSAEVVGVQKQVTGVEEEIEELSKKHTHGFMLKQRFILCSFTHDSRHNYSLAAPVLASARHVSRQFTPNWRRSIMCDLLTK